VPETQPQPVPPSDLEAFDAAFRRAFHDDGHPDDVALDLRTWEPERSLAIRDGGEIVATAAAFTRTMTVPGGREVPVGAVSAVSVSPGHTRRGHLTTLMRRQLDDIRAAGEPLAVLWASEGAIYGRFGYGSSTRRVGYELRLAEAALRPDLPLPAERARLADPHEALPDLTAAYEKARRVRPGLLDRDDRWWERVVYDPEHKRDGAGARRAVVQRGDDGEPAGYALYAVAGDWDERSSLAVLRVRELVAATPEAHLGLWSFLLSIDLMRTLTWSAAPDHDPIAYALRSVDPLARKLHSHGLWVRLVDVGSALSARAYSAPLDLVLELEDAFCPWNAGRWHIAPDGTCERTDRAPDLALDAEALGSVYLGSTPLDALAATGGVRELTPGALVAASAGFRGFPEPYCPELF
jgi:predicted acetyltransferase